MMDYTKKTNSDQSILTLEPGFRYRWGLSVASVLFITYLYYFKFELQTVAISSFVAVSLSVLAWLDMQGRTLEITKAGFTVVRRNKRMTYLYSDFQSVYISTSGRYLCFVWTDPNKNDLYVNRLMYSGFAQFQKIIIDKIRIK